MYITPRQKKRYILNTLFFLIAIPLTVIAGYSAVQYISGANTEAIPSDVALSNLTTNSLTITWTTPAEATGEVIVIADGQQSQPFTDFRGSEKRKTHFIEIVDLAPSTEYEFIIKSNGNEYTSEEGNPFTFTTSPLTQDTPVPNPVYGTISGDQGDDALVYIFTASEPQSLALSTVPASTGNWIADLSALRTKDGSGLVPVSAETQVTIVVVGPDGTGADHTGAYSETFDGGGKLDSSVDLTLAENPDITSKLPSESLVTGVGQGNPPAESKCNESCSETTPCAGTLSCSGGVCRNSACSDETDCTCPDPEPEPEPDKKACNGDCTTSTDCETDLICSSGQCRNPECSEESSCACPEEPEKPEFDPSKREFLIKQDIPWVDMFSGGGSANPPDDDAPSVITGAASMLVVNQSDTSYGITWVSDRDQSGYVRYGVNPSSLSEEANDVRDSLVERGEYNSHLIEINNLEPETTYYYEVVSGGQTYDNNGSPFQLTTYATLSSPPPFDTVSGVVSGADSIDDVVVLVQLKDEDGSGSAGNSNFVAVVLDTKGGWIASIGDVRNDDGSEYFQYTDGDILVADLYIYADTDPVEVPATEIPDTLVELQALFFLYPNLWEKFRYIFV